MLPGIKLVGVSVDTLSHPQLLLLACAYLLFAALEMLTCGLPLWQAVDSTEVPPLFVVGTLVRACLRSTLCLSARSSPVAVGSSQRCRFRRSGRETDWSTDLGLRFARLGCMLLVRGGQVPITLQHVPSRDELYNFRFCLCNGRSVS